MNNAYLEIVQDNKDWYLILINYLMTISKD